MSNTRERILDVAWALLEEGGEEAATISAIAHGAGISRQALYFHFADRAELFAALVVHVDDQRGLQEWVDRLEAAPTGTAKLELLVAMQAERNPTFAPVARVLEAARHGDDAAAAAWSTATEDRRAGCRDLVVPALVEEGAIHAGWDLDEAALLLSELTSFVLWDDLVDKAGLAPDRYRDLVAHTALAALATAPEEGRTGRAA